MIFLFFIYLFKFISFSRRIVGEITEGFVCSCATVTSFGISRRQHGLYECPSCDDGPNALVVEDTELCSKCKYFHYALVAGNSSLQVESEIPVSVGRTSDFTNFKAIMNKMIRLCLMNK